MSSTLRKCPKCRERTVTEIVEPYSVTLEHDGRSYEIAIPDLVLLKCAKCGNRVIPDEPEDRLSAELRKAIGLLPPDEIRRKRLALDLTQKQLADHLKIAEETLCRWERGGQIPQRHSDLILRAYFDVPEFREYLKRKAAEAAPTSATIPQPAASVSV